MILVPSHPTNNTALVNLLGGADWFSWWESVFGPSFLRASAQSLIKPTGILSTTAGYDKANYIPIHVGPKI